MVIFSSGTQHGLWAPLIMNRIGVLTVSAVLIINRSKKQTNKQTNQKKQTYSFLSTIVYSKMWCTKELIGFQHGNSSIIRNWFTECGVASQSSYLNTTERDSKHYCELNPSPNIIAWLHWSWILTGANPRSHVPTSSGKPSQKNKAIIAAIGEPAFYECFVLAVKWKCILFIQAVTTGHMRIWTAPHIKLPYI